MARPALKQRLFGGQNLCLNRLRRCAAMPHRVTHFGDTTIPCRRSRVTPAATPEALTHAHPFLPTMKTCRHLLIQLTMTFLALAAPTAQSAEMKPGAGRFDFTQGGKTIPVWYFLPSNSKPDTRVLFVMHGVKRDAERYRDEWLPHARKHGFILVAPEFSEKDFPGSDSYNSGNTVDEKGRHLPRSQWSFSFLEPVFDEVKKAASNRSERYSIYGHSAGAQFVHRYLYFMPKARVAHAVAANAGWWTLPDLDMDFPYGLRGSGIHEDELKAMLQQPLVVLLGTADTDPNHVNLRRTPEAMAQGPYRFARGQFFYAAGQRQAKALGVPLGWKLETAPGVAHVDKDMAPYAVEALFGRNAPPVGKQSL
jgi:poly(3-hydroxybutyrate) depolymerase